MTNRSIVELVISNATKEIQERTGMKVLLVPTFPRDASHIAVTELLNEMCKAWGVTADWLRIRNKKENRPMMRKIFWLAAKKQYPSVSHSTISILAGAGDHATSIKGVRAANDWLSVQDELFMKFYNPVRDIIETELANH